MRAFVKQFESSLVSHSVPARCISTCLAQFDRLHLPRSTARKTGNRYSPLFTQRMAVRMNAGGSGQQRAELSPAQAERQYDLVIIGATGFTGRLICRHIAENYAGQFRWAIAGRNRDKLREISAMVRGIDSSCSPNEVLCDTQDLEAVNSLASSTRVVISTAGPFWRYSKPVTTACARAGTCYIDITGEPSFVRWNIEHLADDARRTGARIVSMAGFDCMPSDMLAFHAVRFLREQGLAPAQLTVTTGDLKGAASGGTLHTVCTIFEDFPLSELAKMDTYYLAPEETERPDKSLTGPTRTEDGWLAPWFFGGVNSQLVHRSAALLKEMYGEGFRYREGVPTQSFLRAALLSAIPIAIFFAGLTRLLRLLVWVLGPKPGEGPSMEAMKSGKWSYNIVAEGTAEDGSRKRFSSKMVGIGDPGYWDTSRMALEAALCVVLQEGDLDAADCVRSGVLTPASAFGDILKQRLKKSGFVLDYFKALQ